MEAISLMTEMLRMWLLLRPWRSTIAIDRVLFPVDRLPWSHDFQLASSGNRLMPEASRGFQLFLQLSVTCFMAQVNQAQKLKQGLGLRGQLLLRLR